jgi:putative heme transporter
MATAALHPEETPDRELALPSLDLRALARRAALPAALAAIAVAVVLVAGGPLDAFADALRRALDADPAWVAAAAFFELASFGGYIALLWLVGGRASSRLGPRESMQITLGGAAATRLLPTAGVGGAALTLWALRKSGMSTRAATRTLLTFLVLLYSVFLASILAAGTLLALSGDGPLALTALPAAAAALGIALPLVAAALARDENAGGRVLTAAAVLGGAVRDALRHVRAADVRLFGAVVWWALDAAVLWAMLHAFGVPPAFELLVFAYFVGQVANTIPIPGAASGGLVGVLLAFGVQADLAIVSVLAYRSIAIWLPAPMGLLALQPLRRTLARWGSEPADAVQVAPAADVAAPAAVTPAPLAPAPLAIVAAADADPGADAAPQEVLRLRPCERRAAARWVPREAATAQAAA